MSNMSWRKSLVKGELMEIANHLAQVMRMSVDKNLEQKLGGVWMTTNRLINRLEMNGSLVGLMTQDFPIALKPQETR